MTQVTITSKPTRITIASKGVQGIPGPVGNEGQRGPQGLKGDTGPTGDVTPEALAARDAAAGSAATAGTKASEAAASAALADQARLLGASIGFATKADMGASLAHPDGTLALVTSDATPANNGAYRKSGASGSGSWVLSADRVTGLEGRVSSILHQIEAVETMVAVYGNPTMADGGAFDGGGIYAASWLTGAAGTLQSVTLCVGGAGTGTLYAYKPVAGGYYENIGIWPVTFDAAGTHSFAAGAGVVPADFTLPAGSFIAYKATTAIMFGTAGGSWSIISGGATLGSIATRAAAGSSFSASLSCSVSTASGLTIAERVGGFDENLAALQLEIDDVADRMGAPASSSMTTVETLGETTANSGTLGAVSFAPAAQAQTAGFLKSVEVRIANGVPGEFELRHYRQVAVGLWQCLAIWPVSVGFGLQTLLPGGGEIPSGVRMEPGDFIGFTSSVPMLRYAGSPGTSWAQIATPGEVGSTTGLTISDGFSIALSFSVGVASAPIETRLGALADAVASPVSVLKEGTFAYAIGDSSIASYGGSAQVIDLVSTTRSKVNLAVPGQTISQQLSVWEAADVDGSTAGWVIVQIGLNDIIPGGTAATIAELQTLINVIRERIGPQRALLVSKMLPCRQRLMDLYGPEQGLVSQQKWVDMNAAIAGNGPTPITGVSGRITAHVPLLDDGAGNLRPEYDTGDGVHENDAARQIIADAWRDALRDLTSLV